VGEAIAVVGMPARPVVNWVVVALAATVACGMLAGSAGAVVNQSAHASGRIAFYADVGNPINSPYSKNPLEVRPARLLLAEDGSVALLHLRWRNWGSSVARSTGALSASNCTPNCATGKRTTSPARLTLSRPGHVLGHRVYRCFQVTVPSHRQSDQHDCLRRTGTFIAYSPVSTSSSPPTTTGRTPPLAQVLFQAGLHLDWLCDMAADGVNCGNIGKGYEARLSPNGAVAICKAGRAACKVPTPRVMHQALGIGKQVTLKPFRCSYATSGLTCIVITMKRGFRINPNDSVTRVGP